jgi:anhydro-N-acetylmuramic acid kinase
MSGTSLDGLDLTYITFKFDEKVDFEIIFATTIQYSPEWQNRLQNLVLYSKEELKQTDIDYTIYLGKKIKDFIVQNEIKNIDAICSHGHTALHQPEIGLTYQIGNLSQLAEIVKNKVVCDFRVQDVEFGGQGAPLVPIGDKLLFSNYDFCLNLGGFANISYDKLNMRLAYDICPVNVVLNHYSKKIGLEYDADGKVACSGVMHDLLLQELNSLAFYHQDYPKSLGLEWVRINVIPLVDSFKLSIPDILRTFTEHIAIQIVHVLNNQLKTFVLVTGGGAYNSFLIDLIKQKCSNNIVVPNDAIIEYKEALIFGLLGVLKLREEINCLSSVTGARFDHSSGKIYEP